MILGEKKKSLPIGFKVELYPPSLLKPLEVKTYKNQTLSYFLLVTIIEQPQTSNK